MANSVSGYGDSSDGVQEKSVYKRAFSLLDEDKDGRISTLDIQRCLRWVGKDVDINVLNKIIRNYRKQHLDLLSEDGFFRSVVWEEEDKKVDGLHKEFRKYEKDDGCGITAKSLKKMLSTLGEEWRTKQCVKMIRSFYPNGDDVDINFEEFKVLRFFSTFLKRVEYNIQIVGVRERPQGQGRKIDKD